MRTVLLSMALGLALMGCTAGDVDVPPTSAESSATESDAAGASEKPRPGRDGPLSLDDARGRGCASLRYGREYTWWENVLQPDEDVVLTGIRLAGAHDVRAPGQAYVAEIPRTVPASGFTLGFPPGPDVTRSRNIDWAGRQPAVGARLAAGTTSNLWVRIRVDAGARRAGYRGLELWYTAGGQEFTALSDIRMRFRARCD